VDGPLPDQEPAERTPAAEPQPGSDQAELRMSPDSFLGIKHPQVAAQLQWFIGSLHLPLRSYPGAPRGNDDDPNEPWYEAFIHEATERVFRGETSPMTLTSVLYGIGAQPPNILNNIWLGGVFYAFSQVPPSLIREFTSRLTLERPVLEDPNLNTALNIAALVGLVHGVDGAMHWAERKVFAPEVFDGRVGPVQRMFLPESRMARGLGSLRGIQLASGITRPLARLFATIQVLNWIKETLAADTLQLPEFVMAAKGDSPWLWLSADPNGLPPGLTPTGRTITVRNPLKILPSPSSFGPDGEAQYASSWDYWLTVLAGALTVSLPEGLIFGPRTGQVGPQAGLKPVTTAMKIKATLLTILVTALNYAITYAIANPPPPGDPVVAALRATGIPAAWNAIDHAWHEPSPDSLGENLASTVINHVHLAAALLWQPVAWSGWLERRNELLGQAREARYRGDLETAARLEKDPRTAWFDPEAPKAIKAILQRIGRAWNGIVGADVRGGLGRALQTPLVAWDVIVKAPAYLGQVIARDYRDLNPGDPPPHQQLQELRTRIKRNVDRILEFWGVTPSRHPTGAGSPAVPTGPDAALHQDPGSLARLLGPATADAAVPPAPVPPTPAPPSATALADPADLGAPTPDPADLGAPTPGGGSGAAEPQRTPVPAGAPAGAHLEPDAARVPRFRLTLETDRIRVDQDGNVEILQPDEHAGPAGADLVGEEAGPVDPGAETRDSGDSGGGAPLTDVEPATTL